MRSIIIKEEEKASLFRLQRYPLPIEATGGGPSAMQPNSLSDAHYQTAPSKCSAQTLHRQTGACLLKHEFVAYQTGTCLLNYKYDTYQTGACLLNYKFESYQTGTCLLNHRFAAYRTGACLLNCRPEAYRKGTLNVQRTLREVDWPPERPFDPRRKASPRIRSVPVPAAWPFYPFFAALFTVRSKYPTNKRMDRQHQTE